MTVTIFQTVLLVLTIVAVNSTNEQILDVVEAIFSSRNGLEIKSINFIDGNFNGDCETTRDLTNAIFKRVASKLLTMRVLSLNENFNQSGKRFVFKVILIDTFESFKIIHDKVLCNQFHFGGYYMFIYENATSFELRAMLKSLWDLFIHNVNILTKNMDQSISVWTFIPFSDVGCNKTDPFLLAKFANGSFNPQPQLFFPDKFQNFHNCPLKVATFESLSPSVLRTDYTNGSYRLYGRDVEVMTTLAKNFNFLLDIFYVTPYGGWGSVTPPVGAIGRAIRRESDFIIGNIMLKYERSLFMDFSYVYFIDNLVLMLPPGSLLSSFKKMFRPFGTIVWMFISGTLLIGFFVISLLEFQSQPIKDLFYGEGVSNPYLNVLAALFGGTQRILPKKTFARIILMVFLMYCLVIR